MIEATKLTLSDIRTRVRDIINESTADFFTNVDVDNAINEGYRVISALTKCIKSIDSAVTVSGTREVAFTGYKVDFVEYLSSPGLALRIITPKHIGNIPSKGTGPSRMLRKSKNEIAIDPLPDGAYSLSLYISDYPSVYLVSDTDMTEMPIAYDLCLVYYAAMILMVSQGNMTGAYTMNAIINSELAFIELDKSTYIVEDTASILAPVKRVEKNE